MKFAGVCIAVKDIEQSKKFYQELFGLKVTQDYGINVSFGTLSLQQEFDWLTGLPKQSIVEKSHNMELYFEENDFDGFLAALSKRNDVEFVLDGVKEATWGQRSVRFYDLDGHIIEVGENMKTVVQRFLDSGMTMKEVSKRMDVSESDLKAILCNEC